MALLTIFIYLVLRMARIKLTASAMSSALLDRYIPKVNKAIDILNKYAESISPTDTRDYISSFRKESAYRYANAVIGIL